MTELLSQAQLEQMASVAEMPRLRPTRPTLVRGLPHSLLKRQRGAAKSAG
jgi:hypothetical protein